MVFVAISKILGIGSVEAVHDPLHAFGTVKADVADGRRTRSESSERAIVDASLALVEEGKQGR